jgi:hypothetical protein
MGSSKPLIPEPLRKGYPFLSNSRPFAERELGKLNQMVGLTRVFSLNWQWKRVERGECFCYRFKQEMREELPLGK